jgi:hypothetical protein
MPGGKPLVPPPKTLTTWWLFSVVFTFSYFSSPPLNRHFETDTVEFLPLTKSVFAKGRVTSASGILANGSW